MTQETTHLQNRESSGRAALVTGGAVRVGRAIATLLARSGYRIAVHYCSSGDKAEELASEIGDSGGQAFQIQADLTRPGAPASVVARAVDKLGRLDLLVINAAVFTKDDADMEELARMKILNVDAAKASIDSSIPHLVRSGGSIVNIADSAGFLPLEKHMAYSRTKATLIDVTIDKAIELAPLGVRVNAVSPGTVLPPSHYDERQIARLLPGIPMGRIGRPEDVAEAVVYLAGALFVTGQIINVDGGRSLRARQADKSRRQGKCLYIGDWKR